MKLHLVVIAILLCLLACSRAGDTKPRFVGIGHPFTLTLPASPSLGYQWKLAKPLDETRLKLLGTQLKSIGEEKPGAACIEVWKFEPVGEGDVEISLKYVHSEKKAPPERTTNFLFRVVKRLGV